MQILTEKLLKIIHITGNYINILYNNSITQDRSQHSNLLLTENMKHVMRQK